MVVRKIDWGIVWLVAGVAAWAAALVTIAVGFLT